MDALSESIVFDPDTGFGGNGVGDDLCVSDGPFSNLTLHLTQFSNDANYCLSRNLNQTAFQDGDQANLDACFSTNNYSDAWPCWSTLPHGAAHLGVNGVMYDAVASPGDSLFYLHHVSYPSWSQLSFSCKRADLTKCRLTSITYGGSGRRRICPHVYSTWVDVMSQPRNFLQWPTGPSLQLQF